MGCIHRPQTRTPIIIRGNSLETPNVWVLSSFHPKVWKQPPPPQCLGFVLFSPRRFYRAELAGTWTPRQQLTGRGSHVAAMSTQGKTCRCPRHGSNVASASQAPPVPRACPNSCVLSIIRFRRCLAALLCAVGSSSPLAGKRKLTKKCHFFMSFKS